MYIHSIVVVRENLADRYICIMFCRGVLKVLLKGWLVGWWRKKRLLFIHIYNYDLKILKHNNNVVSVRHFGKCVESCLFEQKIVILSVLFFVELIFFAMFFGENFVRD